MKSDLAEGSCHRRETDAITRRLPPSLAQLAPGSTAQRAAPAPLNVRRHLSLDAVE